MCVCGLEPAQPASEPSLSDLHKLAYTESASVTQEPIERAFNALTAKPAEPREWTLRISSENDGSDYLYSGSDVSYPQDDYLRVIEKSAYEHIERRLRNVHRNAKRKINGLRVEIEKLTADVEFWKKHAQVFKSTVNSLRTECKELSARLSNESMHYSECIKERDCYRAALERIAKNVDDIESYEIASDALEEKK